MGMIRHDDKQKKSTYYSYFEQGHIGVNYHST